MIGPQQVSIGKTAQLVHYFVRGNHFPYTVTWWGRLHRRVERALDQIYDDHYNLSYRLPSQQQMQTENINFMNNTGAGPGLAGHRLTPPPHYVSPGWVEGSFMKGFVRVTRNSQS